MHEHVSPMGWSPIGPNRLAIHLRSGVMVRQTTYVPVGVGFLGGRSELQASLRALRPGNDTGGVSHACAQRDHDGLKVPVGMR